jgi:chromosome segregation ATPase
LPNVTNESFRITPDSGSRKSLPAAREVFGTIERVAKPRAETRSVSRKRKQKKGRSGGEGQWTTTGVDTSASLYADPGEARSSAVTDDPSATADRGEKNNLAGRAGEGIRLDGIPEGSRSELPDAPDSRLAVGQPENSSNEPERPGRMPAGPLDTGSGDDGASDEVAMSGERPPVEGLFAKLTRWWRGPSPVTVRVPSNPPGAIAAQRIPTPPPAPQKAPERLPSGKTSEASGVTAGGPSSAVSQVHAVLMLERVLPELEETKRQLQTERESSQSKIRELESDRERFRAEAERARNERADLEGHTNMLRKSVGALERQLHEERSAAATKAEEYEARLRSFEESVKSSRNPVAELRAELQESQLSQDQLESLLENAKEELERARRELQEERELAQGRIQQLESELTRKSGAGEQAVAERKRIEERAALVQKALDVMEQQLREERESSGRQVQQLEADLSQARAKSAQLETRVNTLIGELERAKSRPRKKSAAPEPEVEESTTLTTRSAGRIQELESELATDSTSLPAERQTATTRLSRLESRWEDLKSRLLPKDKEISELRQQAEEFRAQIESLETALAEARQQSDGPGGEVRDGGEEAGSGLLSLSRDAVQTLYNQSMGKLTVLMASADIALMNPKLDPKAKSSVQDIKNEGQALLELIKSYTLPPEAKKSN